MKSNIWYECKYVYISSGASPHSGRYQIILACDRGMCVYCKQLAQSHIVAAK